MSRLRTTVTTAALLGIAASFSEARGQMLSGPPHTASSFAGVPLSASSVISRHRIPNICSLYYFVTVGPSGSFPDWFIHARFPQCANRGSNGGDEGGTSGTGSGQGGSGGQGGIAGGGSNGGGSNGGGGNGGQGGSGGQGGQGGIGGVGNGGSSGGGSNDGGGNGENGGGNGNQGDGGSHGGNGGNGGPQSWPGPTTAAPEPVSLLLLGTGLAGVGGAQLARRRQRNR